MFLCHEAFCSSRRALRAYVMLTLRNNCKQKTSVTDHRKQTLYMSLARKRFCVTQNLKQNQKHLEQTIPVQVYAKHQHHQRRSFLFISF